ncbi:MAG: peptidylprolyl isomerase [Candidatus Paceibacterota bacterium]
MDPIKPSSRSISNGMKIKGLEMTIAAIVCSAVILTGLILWQNNRSDGTTLIPGAEEAIDGPFVAEEQKVKNPLNVNNMNPTAVIKTNLGTIELELFADLMPITTGNFMELAESGFYDGTKFHRVIDGFMIQGGDPNSRGNNEATYGMGGPEENIQDEFVSGELLTNTRGTIAMANTGQPNSGGSQWFINLGDNTNLDFDKQPLSSKHPVFGRVVKGVEVVDAIAKVETDQRDIPASPVVVESVTISK